MKGLELNVTKQNGMTLVEYQLGVADVYDDRVSDKVAQLGNIIPFQYKDEDGKRSIVSYVHHDTSLEVMLRQTLKKADVLAILKGLLCAFEIGAAGVQICYLVRDLNYIYVDPESKAVKCIMVPVKQDPLGQSDIPDFFRNIVSHMRFDEADKDDYVARILTLINTDHYSNMKLKGLVDAEMEKLGRFYTRDEGLKKEADTTPAPEVQNQNVKVNRVGVMNNMRPQGMPAMGQPMGQPVPPMGGQPMMGQPVPPMGGQPMMGQPVPPMGRQPMGQPVPPMGGQPMGQYHRWGRCLSRKCQNHRHQHRRHQSQRCRSRKCQSHRHQHRRHQSQRCRNRKCQSHRHRYRRHQSQRCRNQKCQSHRHQHRRYQSQRCRNRKCQSHRCHQWDSVQRWADSR